MEDIKKIQEFFSKPLNENIVVRMYNPTDKTADLYKEDNPGLEFYLTGREGQDYVRKYKDHISFPFSSHMNDGTPISNYEENKEKLTAYLNQNNIPFKTTSAKPFRGVSRTSGEEFMYTTDTFKVPLSHVDIKDISLNEGKQLDKSDFAKVVKAVEQTGHPVTVLLIPKFNEIEVLTGMDAPDDMLRDLSNAVDSLGYGRNDIIIAGDSSNLSRREYSDIFRVNGGHKDYFEESVNEMDMNDPVLMRMRAEKDKLAKMRAANAGDDGNDKFFDNAKKIAFLKKERAQLMRDMEQEAEPEGGPIADEYGAKLNRIDAAIAKLSGRKEMTYDQAIAENNSYVRVSEPKFIKDKNNPNFLYVNFKYDTGGGVLTAFGKETMSGQIRRLSSAEAMKQATTLAKDLEAKYNLEDIDVYDKKNGVVQIFAVSDDFVNMNPNMLGEIKESLNPEVSNAVNRFIKAMAKRYDYSEQDAVYAIMAALKQRDFKGVNEAEYTDYSNNELAAYCKNNPTDKKASKELHKRSQALKGLSRTDVNEQADHVNPMVAKAYKEYLKAKKDGDGEKAYRYYSKKLNNTYSTRADRDAIEAILKKKYGSALDESVNEGGIEDIQKQLDALGVKYEMSKTDKVRPFKVIYKPINKSDKFYDKFEDIVDLANLKGVVKTSMDEATKEEETEFHSKLDKLVHDTFGKRKGEMEENMSLDDQAKAYFLAKVKSGEINTLPEDPKAAFLAQMMKDQIDHDEETLRRERGLEETSAYIAETIKLGLMLNEELCDKGKRYIKARQAAGEKSSAYLSGRAVRVCKGQIEWPKKGKKKK